MNSFLKTVVTVIAAAGVAWAFHAGERSGIFVPHIPHTPQFDSYHLEYLYVAPLENGCLIDAEQAFFKLPDGLWKHVLLVNYAEEFGGGGGHAMLLFDVGGQVWVYDRAGSRPLHTESHDPKVIVKHLIEDEDQPIISAGYVL